MATKIQAPCWADGLACPSLRGLDPAKLARDLVSRSAASVASAGGKGGGVSVATVDEVFALVQLGLDDRQPTPAAAEAGITHNSPEAEKAFRSALAPGALGLVPKLAAALQHRDGHLATDGCGGGGVGGAESAARDQEQQPVSRSGRGQRDAVVLAAGHLTAMEQLVTRQNNTPALLMAHNALAKLLKNNWPWLVGGVVDAPRLLSRLCEIYRDGLDQLKIALAQADAKHAASGEEHSCVNRSAGGGAGDTAHLKKFGKLLATFGTRMACLLRHLGPECPPRERRAAFRLYAKATASVYPGLLASLRARDFVGDDAATAGGVAGCIIYPKAVEAFVSTTDEPPCCQSGVSATGRGENGSRSPPTSSRKVGPLVDAGGSSCAAFSSAGGVAERERNLRPSCRCYEGTTTGPLSGRRHDPWEALEALRPTPNRPTPNRPPPIADPSRTSSRSSDASAATDDSRDAVHEPESSVDPLGAVLLLCEFLRRGYGTAPAAGGARGPRREACCAWVLDHLAALFPGWVDSAAGGGGGQGGAAAALTGEVSATLGVFVCRRAMDGEFQEAQVQLIEGCSCHPHPVCREVWVGALKVFLGRCDSAAQEACIQSLTNAALDPRVSRRCRRRLGRALAAVCVAMTTGVPLADSGSPTGGPSASAAVPLLLPRARAGLFQACLSRLRGEQLDEDSSGDSSIRASGGRGGGGGGGGSGGACALDLLRALPSWRSFSGVNGGGHDDEELTAASASFARTSATTADLLRSEAARGVRGEHSPGSSLRQREEEDNLVAGARFLAARPQQERKQAAGAEVDMGGEAEGGLGAAAREVARELGGMLTSSGLSGGLSERALSAITRLVAREDPDRLPQLCSVVAREAVDGRVGGEAVLALAEGLSSVGQRQPLPSKGRAGNIGFNVWKSVLQDGFGVLFGSRLWPVVTAAMETLEAVARCVDPSITALLPRQIPEHRLAAFKGRLGRRTVYLDGGGPIKLEEIRERGLAETRVLSAAAVALAAKRGTTESEGQTRQIVLKEGGDLSALAGLLANTVTGIRLLSEREGGGVCLTLKGGAWPV